MTLNNNSRCRRWFGAFACLLLVGASLVSAAEPQIEEVRDLLRAELPDAKTLEMKESTVESLLARFAGRVRWVESEKGSNQISAASPLVSRLFDGRFAYIHPSRFDALASEVPGSLRALVPTNSGVVGGIIDLRFVTGRDCSSALRIANALVAEKKPLLDCGDGLKDSEGAPVLGRMPWVVLVNQATKGSPEGLAAALRQAGTAVVIGARTAGHAATFREFTLKTGQTLSIATRPYRLGDGQSLPTLGVAPDVEVKVDPEQERLAMAGWAHSDSNPISGVGKTARPSASIASTNRPARRRLNEADLVRMQREGKRPDLEVGPPSAEVTAARVEDYASDPALARGLDLLKALAIVRQVKPSPASSLE